MANHQTINSYRPLAHSKSRI